MDKYGDLIAAWLVILAVALFAAISLFGQMMECRGKTSGMGIPWRYEIFGGCQVEPSIGVWIPLDNYRYVGE